MRRFAPALLCAALLLAVACSDQQQPQPTGPTSVSSPSHVEADPADSARIVELIHGSQTLIQGLFGTVTDCTGNCNAAITKFDQIAELYTAPPPYNMAAVVSHTYDLINWILQKWEAGTLNDPPGDAGVTELVNLLFTYAGIDATICDLGADCDFSYYQPGSPPLTLLAPSGWASLQADSGTGTVTQPTILSLYRLTPDNDLTMLYLMTQLDQYPLQYEYSTSSGEEFLRAVTITICLADDVSPPNPGRLALAHNVAEPAPFENIQILPSAGGGSLFCDGATTSPFQIGSAARPSLLRDYAVRGLRTLTGLLSPTPLQATMLAGSGITGSAKNLSPFGIVDPVANISSALTSTDLGYALTGQATSAAPKVKILTPMGNPMTGDSAIFTITGGGGSLTAGSQTGSSVVVYTDASGEAAVDSWTLGTGSNTVQVTGAISPCDAPVATGTAVNCGTVLGTVTFTATGVPPVSISTTSLPNGTIGVAYGPITLAATGGTGSYSWAVTSGTLPAGLSLSTSGVLDGTPTAIGSSTFTVTASSTSGSFTASDSKSYTISVTYPTAVNVSFVAQPSDYNQCYAVDAPISPPVKVLVTTTTGTPLAGVPVSVIAVLNNGSTVVVSDPNETTGSNGIAVFSSLSINKSGAYQLRVGTTTPWPVTNVLSNKFKISPKC